MAMIEHRIRGEIVGHRNEVSARSRLFSRSTDPRFGIGDDSALPIDESRLYQWRERQNDRSRITTRIRHQSGSANMVGVEFRKSVDRSAGELRSADGVVVLKVVNC